MSHDYIINIYGPSTAGKSTLAELLQKSIERIYTVDYDIIKRQIASYSHKTDKQVATDLTYAFLSDVAATDLPVLSLLPPPPHQDAYEKIAATAQANNRRLINIEVTAPNEVLIERYKERLQRIKASGSTWSFRTLDEFIDNLQKPYYTPSDTHTFDSSKLSPDEILANVKQLL